MNKLGQLIFLSLLKEHPIQIQIYEKKRKKEV